MERFRSSASIPFLIGIVFVVIVGMHGMAHAEQDEITVGLEGGLMMPGFAPTSSTAFTLATWSVGAVASYGLLDDLSLIAAFGFSMFEGEASEYSHTEGSLTYDGDLRFSSRLYHPQAGFRYKLYSGYNLAPYIDLRVGYAWSTYHDPRMVDENGTDLGVDLSDFGEGAFTVTAGVSVDYRIANTVFVGVGFLFTYAAGDGLLKNTWSMPVQASYYW